MTMRHAGHLLLALALTAPALAFCPGGAGAAVTHASPAGDVDAMHIIQTNLQRMTPAPWTADRVQQEMPRNQAMSVARTGSRARNRFRSQDERESHAGITPGNRNATDRTDAADRA